MVGYEIAWSFAWYYISLLALSGSLMEKIHQSRHWGQPQINLHTNFRIVMNFSVSIHLVKMSAFCRRVSTLISVIPLPFPQWCLKRWYFKPMCFVREVIFTALDIVSAPLLSSKIVDLITAVSPPPRFIYVTISKSRWRIGMRFRITWIRAIYFASVVLSEI